MMMSVLWYVWTGQNLIQVTNSDGSRVWTWDVWPEVWKPIALAPEMIRSSHALMNDCVLNQEIT
jgi:hypothetical protein